jgi:hypothetical protein
MGDLVRFIGYGVLADAVVLVHLSFILFVAFGAFLVLLERHVAWLHVPAVLYGVAIEFFGWTCPLTPLENHLRELAAGHTYSRGFIDEYLRGFIYPEAWGDIHVWLGVAALVGNGLIYLWIWRRG